MRTSYAKSIRQMLRDNPDGLDVETIASALHMDKDSVRRALQGMPDAYIDRWIGTRYPFSAIWCSVPVPPNCPHPARKEKK